MTQELKPLVTPLTYIDHNRERYKIVVELPNVKRDDIELEVTDNSFCLRAKRDDSDLVGCFFLAHPVDPEGTDAAFADGHLSITIPLRSPIRGKRIEVREGLGSAAIESPRQIEIEEGFSVAKMGPPP